MTPIGKKYSDLSPIEKEQCDELELNNCCRCDIVDLSTDLYWKGWDTDIDKYAEGEEALCEDCYKS